MQFAGDDKQQAKHRDALSKVLEPLRQTLKDTKWLGGKSIGYADIIVGGSLMVSVVSTVSLSPWGQ